MLSLSLGRRGERARKGGAGGGGGGGGFPWWSWSGVELSRGVNNKVVHRIAGAIHADE